MEYRRFGDAYYVRMDRGDEIVAKLLELCKSESIDSATFWGIGGCEDAEIQVYKPEDGVFETERVEGTLELVSLMGNMMSATEDEPAFHAHALFSYRDGNDHRTASGHLKSTTVRYTAEIELRPVIGGSLEKRHDPETGTNFWSFGS